MGELGIAISHVKFSNVRTRLSFDSEYSPYIHENWTARVKYEEGKTRTQPKMKANDSPYSPWELRLFNTVNVIMGHVCI